MGWLMSPFSVATLAALPFGKISTQISIKVIVAPARPHLYPSSHRHPQRRAESCHDDDDTISTLTHIFAHQIPSQCKDQTAPRHPQPGQQHANQGIVSISAVRGPNCPAVLSASNPHSHIHLHKHKHTHGHGLHAIQTNTKSRESLETLPPPRRRLPWNNSHSVSHPFSVCGIFYTLERAARRVVAQNRFSPKKTTSPHFFLHTQNKKRKHHTGLRFWWPLQSCPIGRSLWVEDVWCDPRQSIQITRIHHRVIFVGDTFYDDVKAGLYMSNNDKHIIKSIYFVFNLKNVFSFTCLGFKCLNLWFSLFFYLIARFLAHTGQGFRFTSHSLIPTYYYITKVSCFVWVSLDDRVEWSAFFQNHIQLLFSFANTYYWSLIVVFLYLFFQSSYSASDGRRSEYIYIYICIYWHIII